MTWLKSLAVRLSQGSQFIPDLRKARPEGFRGLPVISKEPCADGCAACRDACPTAAIALAPVRLDLGRCVFCTACEDACATVTSGQEANAKLRFTNDPHLAATGRDGLIVQEGDAERTRLRANAGFSSLFGRSLKMRQVSAGGCNACELELNASANVNFDAQRFGIEWVASPRHADALVVTGPLTANMNEAVAIAWAAMPEPRFLVAVGACAISGGLYDGAAGVDRAFLKQVVPTLFVPGCPPHPLTFVNAILDFLGAA
jgi:Ni,Fe-hydrogenase III small subunit/formate hydrogenlyase subunit 6/NADH:ubiquinone oxidoreductase subunit I